VKTLALQLPGCALQAVAIEVLAREVDDDFFSGVEDRLAESLRCELRMPPALSVTEIQSTRGDSARLACKCPRPKSALFRHRTADRYQLDAEEKVVRLV